jgi:hypothetical protein
MTIDDAELSIGNNQLIFRGGLTRNNGGTLTGGPNSRVRVMGEDAQMTLPEMDLAILFVDRPNGVNLEAPLTLSGSIRLVRGEVENASNLVFANRANIMAYGATLDGTPTFLGETRVEYYGTTEMITGNELPPPSSPVWRMFVNNTEGIVLNSDFAVNNNISLTNGSIDINGRTITLSDWRKGVIEETETNRIFGESGSIVVNPVLNSVTDYDPWNIGLRLTVNGDLKGSTIIREFAPNVIQGTEGIMRSYELGLRKNLNSNLNATMVFSYREDELNGNDESTLILYVRNSTSKPWLPASNQTLSTENNTITVTGIDAMPKYITVRGDQEGDNSGISGNSGTGEEQPLNPQTELIPDEFSLSQNYPNPFNPTTTIKYQMPENGTVSLKVFDMTGREVMNLVSGFKNAGFYQAQFNGNNLASGVYFYKLDIRGETQEFSKIMRMMLIK